MTPEKFLAALERVVEYNWDKEHEDYKVQGCPEGHVFESLRTLNDYLVAVNPGKEPNEHP